MICDKWLHIYGNKLGTGVNCEWVDDVLENVKGEWLHISDGYCDFLKCSQCGKTTDNQSNFCPNCGADMRTAKQIIHDAIDNTPMAEDIYVGIKEKLHKAVDAVDELSREGDKT